MRWYVVGAAEKTADTLGPQGRHDVERTLSFAGGRLHATPITPITCWPSWATPLAPFATRGAHQPCLTQPSHYNNKRLAWQRAILGLPYHCCPNALCFRRRHPAPSPSVWPRAQAHSTGRLNRPPTPIPASPCMVCGSPAHVSGRPPPSPQQAAPQPFQPPDITFAPLSQSLKPPPPATTPHQQRPPTTTRSLSVFRSLLGFPGRLLQLPLV